MKSKDKVYKILMKISSLDGINDDQQLQKDLALDSLAMVSMLIEIEDALGITLKEADMNPFELTTVKEVVDLAARYIGDKDE